MPRDREACDTVRREEAAAQMNIIRMKGGLGNQMFQYALYLSLTEQGRQVKMDDVSGFVIDPQRDPVLTDVFGFTYERATKDEINEMTDRDRHLRNWLRRRFGKSTARIYEEKDDGNFDPGVFAADDHYLMGYWQSERYFETDTVQSRLKQDFKLDPEKVLKTPEAWNRLREIRQSDSVSIHIRRGDYLAPGIIENYGDICTERYYHEAVEYLLDRVPRATFYIFSNDREWTLRHFSGDRFVIMDFHDDQTDVTDLLLMSNCRHNIIANSSYSWWAAWLKDHPDRIVIAPDKWLNTKDLQDIYTDRMVRL